MTEDCYYCKGAFDRHALRPYAPGGAMTCFKCANANPKRIAVAEAQFLKLLNASPGPMTLTDTGPRPSTASEIDDAARSLEHELRSKPQ